MRTARDLTALVFACTVATTALAAQSNDSNVSDADVNAIESYRLSGSVLTRLTLVQQAMYASIKLHPEVARNYAELAGEEDATIDEMAERLVSVPEMKAAVANAGFTPREYMLASLVTFQASMTAAMLDMPGAPRSRLSDIAKQNAAFIKSHSAEMIRLRVQSMELQKLATQAASADTVGAGPDTLRRPL